MSLAARAPGRVAVQGEFATLTLAFCPGQSNPVRQLDLIFKLLCGCLSNQYRLKAGIIMLTIGWLWAAFHCSKLCLCLNFFLYFAFHL